jgi:hypothetical protein
MKNNDTTTYGVKYSGNLLDGFNIKTSAILLHKKANMSIEAIKKLLSLKDAIIKKDISLESANNLVNILRECGLDCSYVSMPQSLQSVEQRTHDNFNKIIRETSNAAICDAILHLGNSRAKEIAFLVMKETTKDSFDSLKENAQEKLSSFIQLSQKEISEFEKLNASQNSHISITQLQRTKHIQIIKNALTLKRVAVVGAVILLLLVFSSFNKSSDTPDIAVTPNTIPNSQPRGVERYDTNQLSRIK